MTNRFLFKIVSVASYRLETSSEDERLSIHSLQSDTSCLSHGSFQYTQEPHPVDFGTINVPLKGPDGQLTGSYESVRLAGDIFCSIPFLPQVDERAVAEVTSNLVGTQDSPGLLINIGLMPNTEKIRKKCVENSFARFAAFTTLKFPREFVVNSEHTFYENLINLISQSTPLSTKRLQLQSEWLNVLFPHDDWAEKQVINLKIVKYFDVQLKRAMTLTSLDDLPVWDEKYNSMLATDDRGATQHLFQGLLKLAFKVGENIRHGFSDLNAERSSDYIGFSTFLEAVSRYLNGTEGEALNRIKGNRVSEEKFDRKRIDTCAVDTVYMLSVLGAGLPISGSVLRAKTSVQEIAENFSHIICRFNAFVSASREVGTPNWSHNDLNIIYEELLAQWKPSEPPITFQKCVDRLFRKINEDFKNIMDIFEGDLIDRQDTDSLYYLAVCLQWGMGSLAAQLTQARYAENRGEGPFVPLDKVADVGSDFWKYLAPHSS